MTHNHKLLWLNRTNHVLTGLGVGYVTYTGQYEWLLLALGMYYVLSLFGNSLGYHRYVAHKSFETYRPVRYFLLFAGMLMGFGSPINWTITHRTHHMYPDTPKDPHSPKMQGFFKVWFGHWSEVKMSPRVAKDLMRQPDIVFCHNHYFKVIGVWCLLLTLIDWRLVVFAFAVPSTIMLYVFKFALAWTHTGGYRNYDTDDGSRNSPMLSWLFLGEGWHNNHHAYPNAWNNRMKWWEIDPPAWLIRVLRKPPAHTHTRRLNRLVEQGHQRIRGGFGLLCVPIL